MSEGKNGTPQSSKRVTIDDQGNIRLLGQAEFDQTEALGNACEEFISST